MEAWPAAQPTNQTTISRLLVNGAVPDLGAARSRVEGLLCAIDLHPSGLAGLAPSAIVCIRKLRDPLPGSLALDQRSLHPPRAWLQSVNDAVGRLILRAARPIREAVPANAECVIFADRAEMLACLAIDWLEGRLGMGWWWRSLLPGLDGSRQVLPFWSEAPEYIPGALLHLANRERSVEFAGRMSADEARDMLRAVVRRLALDDLRGIADEAPSRLAKKVADSYRRLQPNAEIPPPPWKNWAPEGCRIALGPEQRCLLGVTLTLQRAPAVARTRSFAHAARGWFDAAKNESRPGQASALPEAFDQSIAASAPEHESPRYGRKIESRRIGVSFTDAKIDEGGARREVESRRDRTRVPGSEEQPPESEAIEIDFSMSEPEVASVVSRVSTPVVDDSDLAPVDEFDVEPFPQPPAAHEASSETPAEYLKAAPLLEAQIETGFGGLFYLLNFGLYLELYGDITTPSVCDIPLNIWDFLALLGERLIGSELRGDPAWALLARLAGRDETQEPGGDCAMPEPWLMPAQWMKPFEPDGVWRWEANEDRLRVWHPAGFIALDLPLEPGDPARQLRREMEAYAQFTPRLCSEQDGHSGEAQSSLRRWLDWLMPYARARLRLALGSAEIGDVGRALCEYRSRVFVTATHMDVMFSLAESRVEIRRAGLDRDPGWIPATGRIIRFYFE
jgi:hypothetical protein